MEGLSIYFIFVLKKETERLKAMPR